jgi:hypothetical protein
MTDLVAAVDEVTATRMIHAAESALGTLSQSDPNARLGPFPAPWSANASVSNGRVELIAPNVIRIADCELNYELKATLTVDLNDLLGRLCLPQACATIPFIGRVCTPEVCLDFLPVTIPVGLRGTLRFTADFSLNARQNGNEWLVDLVVVGIPSLQLGPQVPLLLTAVQTGAEPALLLVPNIGPLVSVAIAGILNAIGSSGAETFLGPILTRFVSGLALNIYRCPRTLQVLPPDSLDSAVSITLDAVGASISSTNEDELLLTANISPP